VKSYPLTETEYPQGYYVRVWGQDCNVYKRKAQYVSTLVARCEQPDQAHRIAKALSR
jgi:hypothetical protein